MRFFGQKRSPESTFEAVLAPETPFYAVGDVHGCDTLLTRLLQRLAQDAHPTARLVLVGDYVDRGDQSAQVLRRLYEMQQQAGDDMVCLLGNHERMMLDFLDEPERKGARWLRYGGLQTLASFGCPAVRESAPAEDWINARDRFRATLGDDLESWLRGLPLWWQSGNVAVVHASANPNLPMSAQTESALLWGNGDFTKTARSDGIWVVHGHTIVGKPVQAQGRISIDTGAYATGNLTAALVEDDQLSFVTA